MAACAPGSGHGAARSARRGLRGKRRAGTGAQIRRADRVADRGSRNLALPTGAGFNHNRPGHTRDGMAGRPQRGPIP